MSAGLWIVRIADTFGCLAMSLIMARMIWFIAENESHSEEAQEYNHGPISCWFMIVTFCAVMFSGPVMIWVVWTH